MAYAWVLLDTLGQPRERDAVRLIAALSKAWSTDRHTRRVVLVNGLPALRFDRVQQLKFDWSVSVNSRTERTICPTKTNAHDAAAR